MKRPRQHELEDESEQAFRAALPIGWVVRPLDKDYGIDREVEVFAGGESTGYTFKVQLKATDADDPVRSIKMDHIRYWSSLDVPVLICLWHSPSSTVYAKWAHSHDPGLIPPDQQSTTMRFVAADRLLEWRDDVPEQLEVIRSLKTQSVSFPIPLKVVSPRDDVRAQMHAHLRRVLRELGLADLLYVEAEARMAIEVELGQTELTVRLPLNVRSFTLHASAGTSISGMSADKQSSFDAVAMTGALLAGLGALHQGAALLAATLAESRVVLL